MPQWIKLDAALTARYFDVLADYRQKYENEGDFVLRNNVMFSENSLESAQKMVCNQKKNGCMVEASRVISQMNGERGKGKFLFIYLIFILFFSSFFNCFSNVCSSCC